MREGELTVCVGIDPDTQCSGIAVADLEKVHAIGVIDTSRIKLRGRDAAQAQINLLTSVLVSLPWPNAIGVVEGQQVYGVGRANANNLLLLALVSGAAVGALSGRETYLVLPREWKGQQPKGVNQRLTLDHYGWDYKFNGPKKPVSEVVLPDDEDLVVIGGELPVAHTKEAIDALGLALWGARRAK